MSLAKKLNLKPGQSIRLVNAPRGFSLDAPTSRSRSAAAVLVFAKSKAELAKHQQAAIDAGLEDQLAWIAYPKGGQLDTDLNRDILWKLLEGSGIQPVRQVAIDDVWSALRFRPAG